MIRLSLLLATLAALGAACGGDSTVVREFMVEGAGMDPTLPYGTVVEVLEYGAEGPQRGDVILFRFPANPDRQFVKRIIGMPGDSVRIIPEAGEVLVNGEALEEPYIRGTTQCGLTCDWVVPRGHYFVLGDNRPNSSDSRQGWFVPRENILGRAKIDGN